MAYVGILKSRFSEAVTSSCVESGFEAHSTTSAPPSRSAIARFAVSLVTCRQAEARKPFSGFSVAKRLRMISSTGICCAAHSILRLPASASEISLTSPFFISAIATVVLLKFGIVEFRLLKPKRDVLRSCRTLNEARCARAHFHACARGRTQTRRLAQRGSTIGALPGEARAAATEMAVCTSRLVSRAAESQRAGTSL